MLLHIDKFGHSHVIFEQSLCVLGHLRSPILKKSLLKLLGEIHHHVQFVFVGNFHKDKQMHIILGSLTQFLFIVGRQIETDSTPQNSIHFQLGIIDNILIGSPHIFNGSVFSNWACLAKEGHRIIDHIIFSIEEKCQ